MSSSATILMVEDSTTLAEVYKAYLADLPYRLATVVSRESALATLDSLNPDIILLDIELPDGSGLDVLTAAMDRKKPPKVIVMTAHGTSDMAVQAIQQGAFDFLTKPFDATRLQVTVNNAAEKSKQDHEISALSAFSKNQYGRFIGQSPAMQTVYRTLESVSNSNATAFIVGESGTGKELAAEAVHEKSNRANHEFHAINCGAIPHELMESELFGHMKGAFTGASAARDGAVHLADKGTLFLDEICEMDLELQKKLLRFIQTGEFRKVGSNKLERVDVRFVCATNKDPLDEVRAGRFREDLFYRLHVVPVRMPPLRERGADILTLARHFLRFFSLQEEKQFEDFTGEAARLIEQYVWPGNVRQLQNTIHRVVVLNDADTVEKSMLPEVIVHGSLNADIEDSTRLSDTTQTQFRGDQGRRRSDRIEPLWLTEKRAIESAIDICGGNVNQAAGMLQVAPSTIYRKIQSWNKQ